MPNTTGTDGRESGTGQDTPKVCVHVPPRRPLRHAGHGGTLSCPVPLSRNTALWKADTQPPLLIAPLWATAACVPASAPAGQGRMSGRRSRSKGARTERCIVKLLKTSGIAAVRVPLSGAVGGRFAGDIVLPLLGRELCVEVKARADGFRELYCWLDGRDVLIVKADRQEPLVVVRLSLAAEIARLAV